MLCPKDCGLPLEPSSEGYSKRIGRIIWPGG
ncbi:hypothetical protein RS9916_31707 [Synechococcus sp. RS9916]|nr:hypothetical protein RS9916_31707 [Synechococcus sp. RS9916]